MQQAHTQSRLSAVQRRQHCRQQPAGGHGQRADGDGERVVLQQPFERILRAPQLAQHHVRGLYQHLAHRIGTHPARVALEQRRTDDLFDLLQCARQRGLGNVEHARCAQQALLPVQRFDDAQMPDLDAVFEEHGGHGHGDDLQ